MKFLYPDFSKQYNTTYKIRLSTIRPLISTPTDITLCDRIHNLNNQIGKCQIKGILFISSDLKTTIFDKLNQDKKKEEFKKGSYISKDIKYFVEDETGRIEISINSDDFVCTGMCLGFVGELKANKFIVSEIIFPDNLNALDKSSNISLDKTVSCKIAFISGLEITRLNNNSPKLRVISDYLIYQQITDLVIFGCFYKEDFDFFKKCIDSLSSKITLIPELTDFGCQTYPLLPVHKNLLKSINSYSSPSIVNMNNNTLVFYSNGIITDLLKYIPQDIENIQSEADGYRMHLDESKIGTTPSKIQDLDQKNVLTVSKGILKSRLLCPNGPDTLSVIPYNESEIFIIDRPIDYFFVPNCNSNIFYKDEDTNCRIVSIPSFNETKKVLVVDFVKHDFELIEFTE